ncbi:Long-chain-fatty-acid--CoA ligase [Rhodobacteraceae bacterium THAF1]|uniref:acyl-CoA synthetase n=1 Tax=Palleronia sp. THAF1 TaxID=2587842 RepID=UPI000F400A3C|nr:acyl-CoA synthetase [Palleronia sp. THAF1]QFU07562.1 Long-chain-fatty-acid--CoA ligase [Palleronia sp. THAF1]VDC22885.1 Long-chain-fatty-acid--CoA ligase [Rhodobacteraceae bacterium THAF1]
MAHATLEDLKKIEAESAWADRDVPVTVWDQIEQTAGKFADRPALTYQLFSGPDDKAETLTWSQLKDQVAQAANLFRELGVGPEDRVAYLLPNCNEVNISYLAGMVAGVVNPINPLLEPEQIAAILRETNAKVLVTLRAFPKTDVAQKAAAAVADAPNVQHVLEVDLHRYLTGVKKLIVPLIRPKVEVTHNAKVQSFTKAVAAQPKSLKFDDPKTDRICTNFHTGGTTGMPKVAQHKYSGIIYNGWLGTELLFTEEDNLICPLPMFHVFAAVVVIGASISSGAHVVFPTPQGYRGDGVFDNFWKLCERHKITFMITVPTAASALMQRKVDADISKLQIAFCGSSPLPVELYKRFEEAAGVTICEGYGLTEATCLVSINPPDGTKKIGSVGLPFPYTDVKIYHDTDEGAKECPTDVVGEICVASPGVFVGNTYSEADKNKDLYHGDYLRTGDLGRIDADGYVWITGRAKDLIIRGGHNIDPAEIEEVLAGHEAVAMAGAIGQPDAHAGELPCAYVELVSGASVTSQELIDYAKDKINERAAWPKHIEILDEIPKTAVGKVFKPDLRRAAITRVYNGALAEAGLSAEVTSVTEDKKRGLIAHVTKTGNVDEAAVSRVLGDYTRPWEWAKQDA